MKTNTTVYTPPRYSKRDSSAPSVFLAGSIEMGNAEDWQTKAIDYFRRVIPIGNSIDFYNPRRPDWDSSWVQDLNSPNFYEQVSWELDHLLAADFIYMYFDPSTQSPISLLELGMFANSGKMVVCCPNGFYRKGNVDVVCQKFNIPLFTNFEASLIALRNRIGEYAEW